MSVLLEALKKAALEKRNRDESAGGGNAPAVDGEQSIDSQDEADHLPADDAAEPLEQKPVVNAAATDYLARQEARRASPVIDSPEDPPAAEPRAPAVEPAVPATSDEEPSASHREPSALHGEPSAPDEEPSAFHGEPSAPDEEPSASDEEPSASESEPPAPVSEPVEVPVSDTSTAERNNPLGDDFALPDEASEEAPPFAAAPEADDEDDLDLDLHMSAADDFESPVAAAAPEPEPEASASGVDAAEQRRALQQLMSRSRDVLKQRKRRGTYMYAALIFTSLGAIGLYYYALSSDGGLLMPEPAIESAEVFSEPGSLAAEEPASTPLADEPEAAGLATEAVAEAAPVESTVVPDTPAPEVTETLANREPVALVEPVRTAMKPSTEPAFQTESRVLIERRQTPRPLARKVNDAYRAYQAGDIDRASTLYREVLEESPRQRDALLGVAAIAVQRGQYQEALRYYQRRLVDDSGDHFARAGLLALAGQGVTDPELQSEVKLLLDDYPQQAHLHFLLGSLQAAAGSWAEAQRSFFEARSWDRENPDYAYNLAVSLEHLRQPRQALSQYRQALELARVTPPQFDLEVASRRVSYLENRP